MAITSSSPPRPPAGQPATSTRRASPDSRSVPRMTSSSSMRRLQIGQRCAMRMRSSALGSPRLSAGIHETSTETGSSFVWHLRGSRRIAATTNSKAEMSCRSAVGWPDGGPRGPCGLSGRTRGAAGRYAGNRVVLWSRRPSDRRALRAGNSVPARVGQQTVHGCRHHVAGGTRRAVGDRSHRPLDQTDAALVERHHGSPAADPHIRAWSLARISGRKSLRRRRARGRDHGVSVAGTVVPAGKPLALQQSRLCSAGPHHRTGKRRSLCDLVDRTRSAARALRRHVCRERPWPPSSRQGYSDGQPVDTFDLDVVGIGAGDVSSTGVELARWVRALGSGPVLSEASRRTMFTIHVAVGVERTSSFVSDIHYGYGLLTGRTEGRPIVFHTGDNFGFKAMSVWPPENDLALAISSNEESTDFEPVVSRLLQKLL